MFEFVHNYFWFKVSDYGDCQPVYFAQVDLNLFYFNIA